MTEETTITTEANPVGGGEKEVMTKTATTTMMVAVIDTAAENINEAAERGTNHLHRGTIDHLIIVIANDLKRRGGGTTEIHLPAMMIATAIVVLIATAVAPPHLQDVVPNAVKNHAKNHPKSPPI